MQLMNRQNLFFHIDVRSLDNATADTMMARSAEFQWNVNWIAYLPS
jgi:hypothetical protein